MPMPLPHPTARRARAPALAALVALLATAGCGTIDAYDESRVEYVPSRGARRGGHGMELPDDDGLTPERWDGRVSERCREVEPLMRVAAMEHQVDVGLIAGIIHVESSFRPDARSRSGARGLMQVMPKIGKRLKCGDLTDPKRNIQCGLTILKRFMARYDDRVIFGLSAYNAGYKVPNEALEADELPSNYRYVEKVLAARVSYLRYGCGR
jgi:soluble lytic murein transglycosylase-like protein